FGDRLRSLLRRLRRRLSALIGRQPAVGMLHIEPAAGGVLLALGLLSLCLGVFFWRFSRRRSRRNSDLSLSPNLMKKRD
ncbi:hypothetical protein ACV33G_01455, partial [Pseudomonas aeruginosa]